MKSDSGMVVSEVVQMVQSHGSVQLSMGAARIEGMLDTDTVFKLRLLPDTKRKSRQQMKTTIKEIFSMMTLPNPNPKVGHPSTHKVWICLSTATNSMATGYFSSVVPEIRDYEAAFTMCPAAQIYWWLCHKGCLTEDVNRLIRHCFTTSQQQRVTKSKYMKDLGYAVIDDQDADDIINAATTQGIYDLTLGLSDKEKRMMAIGKIHAVSAITYGKAKEGSMEAYNFSSVQLVTSTHSINEKKKKATKTNALVRSLAKSVYSIDTGTSKVTADDTEDKMDDSKDEESDNSNDTNSNAGGKTVAIEDMGILDGKTVEHEVAKTRTDDDEAMKDADSQFSKNTTSEEEFQDEGLAKAGANLLRRMETTEDLIDTSESDNRGYTTPINLLSSEKDGKTYKDDDPPAQSADKELDITSYNSSVTKVDSGVFDPIHAQRYIEPTNFRQALWNEAGPTVGTMNVMLEMIWTEFEGELLGMKADLTHFSQNLINLLIEESGEVPNDMNALLNQTSADISQYKEQHNKDKDIHKVIAEDQDALPPDKEVQQSVASKTQGTVLRAPEATPMEGIATTVNTTAGDKEGPQSVSMAPGG
jgi:hypothetical protein